MKYFVSESERKSSKSSAYFEFQNGYHCGRHWLEDSVSISDDLWDELKLSELFGKAVPEFDYCGLTTVTKSEWNEIVKLAKESSNQWQEVIDELSTWVNTCFETNDIFTICGL